MSRSLVVMKNLLMEKKVKPNWTSKRMKSILEQNFLIPASLQIPSEAPLLPQPTWPSHTNLINKVVVAIRN